MIFSYRFTLDTILDSEFDCLELLNELAVAVKGFIPVWISSEESDTVSTYMITGKRYKFSIAFHAMFFSPSTNLV